jgi:pilus assembly protein Flp/PilA
MRVRRAAAAASPHLLGRSTAPTTALNELFSTPVNDPATNVAVHCRHVGRRLSRTGRQREHQVRQLVLRFIADQTGATAIEYALIATGISIVILASVNSIGTSVSGMITPISTALK